MDSLSDSGTYGAFTAMLLWSVIVGFFSIGSILIIPRFFPHTTSDPETQSIVSTIVGVSVLRPLRGVDYELRENLLSMFEQVYEGPVELLFCVEDPEDPAVPIVRALMEQFEKVDSRIVLSTRPSGENPKVSNLLPAYKQAKHPVLWVLDSNVRVEAGAMRRAMGALMRPGIGLVHHLPYAIAPGGFGARLEQMFLDTNHARMYSGINWTGAASCVNGKSNLYRKDDIERIGGLEAFSEYLAEDNMIAERILALPDRRHLLVGVAWQHLGPMSVRAYYARRSRWTRIRKYNVTAATIIEPFTESIVCGLTGAWAAYTLFAAPLLPFLAFHMVLWLGCDIFVYRWIGHLSGNLSPAAPSSSSSPLSRSAQWIAAWFVREATALPLWAWAMCGTVVEWRGRAYRLRMDGTVARTYSVTISSS